MEETNDIVSKNFETYPDVAADIINVCVHQGKRKVHEEELYPAPTETVYQGNGLMRNQLEDVSKYEVNGGDIKAQYLFANQTTIDHAMLLRKAGYLGGCYREQYEGKEKGTFPVMELIFYWGKKRWNSALSMREMFRKKDFPKEMWEYIDDLKLHVWEMRHLPKEVRELFTSDMRIVVDYLAEGTRYRTNQKVVHKEALIKMLRVLSGDKNVEDTAEMLKEMNIGEEDEITMCELFDQYIRKGISQGISQGINQGIKALIITCKEFGADYEETKNKVRMRFTLSDTELRQNMKLYW